MFSGELTPQGKRSGPVLPHSTLTMYSDTASLFPATLPATVHVFALKPGGGEQSKQLSVIDEAISVPPTIGGGLYLEGSFTLPASLKQYLGLVLVNIDGQGSITKSTVVNVLDGETPDELLSLVKSLPFSPAIRKSHAVPSSLFILCVRQDSKAFPTIRVGYGKRPGLSMLSVKLLLAKWCRR